VLSKIKRKSNFQTVIGQDRQTDKRSAASPSFSPFFTLALKPPLSEKISVRRKSEKMWKRD